MKRVIVLALLVLVVTGCGRNNPLLPNVSLHQVIGEVRSAGSPHSASVMVIWPSGRDTTFSTEDGRFSFSSPELPQEVVAVALGITGTATAPSSNNGIWSIKMEPGLSSIVPAPTATAPLGEYWFGVYDTDNHGDVRFRFRYNFSRFYCVTWVPWVFGQNPDPNTWDNWSLRDFSPWSGRKLLVPTRTRWWHAIYYNFSISNALVLIANS